MARPIWLLRLVEGSIGLMVPGFWVVGLWVVVIRLRHCIVGLWICIMRLGFWVVGLRL